MLSRSRSQNISRASPVFSFRQVSDKTGHTTVAPFCSASQVLKDLPLDHYGVLQEAAGVRGPHRSSIFPPVLTSTSINPATGSFDRPRSLPRSFVPFFFSRRFSPNPDPRRQTTIPRVASLVTVFSDTADAPSSLLEVLYTPLARVDTQNPLYSS